MRVARTERRSLHRSILEGNYPWLALLALPMGVVPGTGVEPVGPRGPADFTYHHSFRYHASFPRFVVWTIPLPYAARHLGRGRLVSTLSR